MNFNSFCEEINNFNTHIINGDLYLGGVQSCGNDVVMQRDAFGNCFKQISDNSIINIVKQICKDYVLYKLIYNNGITEIKSLNRDGEKIQLSKARDLNMTDDKLFDDGITFLRDGKIIIGTDLSRLNMNSRMERYLQKMLNDFFIKVNFDDKTKAMCYIIDITQKAGYLFDIGILDVETQQMYTPVSENYKRFIERSAYFFRAMRTNSSSIRYSQKEYIEYIRAYNSLKSYAEKMLKEYKRIN